MGLLMRNQNAGLLVPSEDPAALCEAMLSVDSEGTQRFAEDVERAALEFDLGESARSLEEMLQSIS